MVEHQCRDMLIGPDGQITARELREINPGIVLVHIAGNVDQADLESTGVRFHPPRLAPTGYMSVATDYLGPRPLMDLHTGGLEVGEMLARERRNGLTAAEAERAVLGKTRLAQGS